MKRYFENFDSSWNFVWEKSGFVCHCVAFVCQNEPFGHHFGGFVWEYLELIFNKDLFLNWKKYNFEFDNILITSAPSNLTELKDVNKNEKAICFVKENSLKQLNGADKIKSHKCKLIENPKGAAWSVYQSHENHNNSNIYVYSVVFKELEKSKVVHTILLSCGKHCEKYLPVFENLVESITLN